MSSSSSWRATDDPDPDADRPRAARPPQAPQGGRAEAFVVRPDSVGWDKALEEGLAGGLAADRPGHIRRPSAGPPPTSTRCSKAIDRRDHVIGRRPGPLGADGGGGWPPPLAVPVRGAGPRRLLALPDPPSRGAGEKIIPQSNPRGSSTCRDPGQGDVPDPGDRGGRRPAPGLSPPVGKIGGDLRWPCSNRPGLRPAPVSSTGRS